jgi:hypothetical protein
MLMMEVIVTLSGTKNNKKIACRAIEKSFFGKEQ